jgi:hypothetical protein
MGMNWKTKGLEGLLTIISERINPWVASAIDECEACYEAKRVLLRALHKEYKEREKGAWHWKDWYRDVIVDVLKDKEAEK